MIPSSQTQNKEANRFKISQSRMQKGCIQVRSPSLMHPHHEEEIPLPCGICDSYNNELSG